MSKEPPNVSSLTGDLSGWIIPTMFEKIKALGYNGTITSSTSETAAPTPLSYGRPPQDAASPPPKDNSTLNPKVADLVSHDTLI